MCAKRWRVFLAQTHRPLEIIVADDGSSDGTGAIVAGFGEWVRYVKQSNKGPATARNLGLSLATGDFVAFLDADDLWHPEKLERQFARFQARPELDYCVTYCQNFWIPELEIEAEKISEPSHFETDAGLCHANPHGTPRSFWSSWPI